MSKVCDELHQFLDSLERKWFPFDKSEIPLNGIYLLYEKGEKGHGSDRIVQVGTHTGINQLPSRLEQHFFKKNKDRSIFRKNIGRASLNKDNDPYLKIWNLKLTSRKEKDNNIEKVDQKKQNEIESSVSEYIQEKCSFVVFREDEKKKRLELKSKLISTVSHCEACKPSPKWMGLNSPIEKIRRSGLWLVQNLYKDQFSENEIKNFMRKYS